MATVRVGQRQTVTVVVGYGDGSTGDATELATWSVDDDRVATVSNAPGTKGLVIGQAPGRTTVTARFGDLRATTTVMVDGGMVPNELRLQVSPASVTRAVGTGAVQLQATASQGMMAPREVTSSVQWTSANPTVAPVVGGTLVCASAGTTMVMATYMTARASIPVTCTPAARMVLKLYVVPADPQTITVGQSLGYQVDAYFADAPMTRVGVTNLAQFASQDPNVVRMQSGNVIRGVAPGTTTVTVSYGGAMEKVTITVR